MVGGWPRFSEYNAAFHSPETGLIPFELKQAEVARNGFGSPDPLSGGFAYIYKLTLPNGKRKAVRVFIQEDPVRDRRIPWVLDRLREEKLKNPALEDLFLDCRWIDPCVRTPVGDVPAMVMDWSEGQTLGEWLRKHRGKPEAIEEFREKFFHSIELLEKAGIAHGDLQMGNILVNWKGHPILVDYDGVAFFDETDPPPIQGGHPNFQHPGRPRDLPSSLLDRFPALTIDLGLAAWGMFSEAPWFGALVSDSDRLYFSRSDFWDPEHSEAFARLKECPPLARAAAVLETLCKSDPRDVPTLKVFRSKELPLKAEPVSAPTVVPAPTPETKPLPETEAEQPTSKRRRKREAWEGKETEYIPVFPLYPALDVKALSKRVGEMVEVIGKVTEIHEGETKYGDPYVFVNFMDWKEPMVFHLVAWSEDLDELENQPSEEWVGKWIQVTGLLEEPYVRKSYRGGRIEQVRYSIRLRQDQQFRFLSEKRARVRLKSASPFREQALVKNGLNALERIGGTGSPGNDSSAPSPSVQHKAKTPKEKKNPSKETAVLPIPPDISTLSNQELLRRLDSLSRSSHSSLSSSSSSPPSSSSPSSSSPPPPPFTAPKTQSTFGTTRSSPDSAKGFVWLFWFGVFVLLLYVLGFLKK